MNDLERLKSLIGTEYHEDYILYAMVDKGAEIIISSCCIGNNKKENILNVYYEGMETDIYSILLDGKNIIKGVF